MSPFSSGGTADRLGAVCSAVVSVISIAIVLPPMIFEGASALYRKALCSDIWYHKRANPGRKRGSMSNKPQNIKGMRGHLPEAMILRQHIINTLIGVFERYGFEPLQTPIVEYAKTLE